MNEEVVKRVDKDNIQPNVGRLQRSKGPDAAGPDSWKWRTAMKTRKFDPAEYLKSPEAQAKLVSEAFGTGDPKFIAHALGTVARTRGKTDISRDSGGIEQSPKPGIERR